MSDLHDRIDLLKQVHFRDVIHAWKLPVSLLAAPFVKQVRKNLWIVSEDPCEARDNGYWFFRYVRKTHPGQDIVYAIKKRSPDYEKVSSLGKTVEYGSLRHWILYLSSSVQVSTQKSGDPNAPVFYFLQVFGFLKNRRLFLQHGVIKDDMPWLHYSAAKISRFLCGAYPEYEFIKERYGYPEGSVCYAGLCRFDGLHDIRTDKKQILIMPTWRNWLVSRKDKLALYESASKINETRYFRAWRQFLESEALREIAETYGVRFLFYPHRNMQEYLSWFPADLPHVTICSREAYDVQELLKTSALLITDYSSVFFDMVYMKKPVIFYQFDYEIFRKGQYPEGYFSYGDTPFGKQCFRKEEVFLELRKQIENQFAVSREYLDAHQRFFPLFDTENTRRAYEIAADLQREKTPGRKDRT